MTFCTSTSDWPRRVCSPQICCTRAIDGGKGGMAGGEGARVAGGREGVGLVLAMVDKLSVLKRCYFIF